MENQNPLAHLLRRNRRFAIPLHLDPIADTLAKRLTPEQLASIQSELSASAVRASQTAAALRTTASATRTGANAATVSTTLRSTVSSFSVAPTYMVGQPVAVTMTTSTTSTTSATPSTSSTTSSTIRAIPSSSSSSSSSSIPTFSSITPSTTSTLPQVITKTQAAPITSISDALPSIVSEQSNSSSSSKSMSTGAVVGIVLAVLVGVVILGSLFGWAYRKFAQRGYKSDPRWRKLDEDITPFPLEKDEPGHGHGYNDDIYGGAAAPVIGSRRALNDHARDGPYPASRPMSEYASNRAGLGSGGEGYAYPAHPTAYGVDVQGRPYNGQAGRVPANVPYSDNYGYMDEKHTPPSPPNARELIGPGAPTVGVHSPPLMPVALGRPAPPRSYSDIASREEYADEPLSAGMAYTSAPQSYEPMTAQTNDWAGTAQPQHQYQSRRISGQTSNGSQSPSPPRAPPMPLPTFAPLSPLSSSFDLQSHAQPLAMYQDEPSRQKQLYGEVAALAGVPEPKTPHSATLYPSISSAGTFGTGTTHSSFSATEHGVRLPGPVPPVPTVPAASRAPALAPLTLPSPHQPYEHGRPLSPLVEVSTPSTIASTLPRGMYAGPPPIASSSIGHNGRDINVNPFDRLPMMSQSSSQRTLVAPGPYSAASTTSFPTPGFPPPSPGGMSVPGSVSESPRRWSGHGQGGNVGMARRSRGESMFDGEDAYGGI